MSKTDLPAEQPQQLTVKEALEQGLKITRSAGSKTGIPIFYVRPADACFNQSRRFVGYDKMERGIQKWFAPAVKYFQVKNSIIGSNNKSNALREFWRVCEGAEIGVFVEVKEIKLIPNEQR